MPIPKFPLLAAFCAASVLARDWMGVKRPAPKAPSLAVPEAASRPAPAPAPRVDTAWLSRSVRNIPVGSPGEYLGSLEGVRCFNCQPNTVDLNLGDSLTRAAGGLSLRTEVWNAIERPLRDRRVYDYRNHCFYFGYRAVDTAYVGGELTEIRLHDVPCYPYLRRTARPLAPLASPAPAPLPAPAAVPAVAVDSAARAPAAAVGADSSRPVPRQALQAEAEAE